MTYWNNFVPASEPWLADNERSTFRRTQLNGLGSQHALSHDAVSSPSGHIQGISESLRQVIPVIQQRPLFSWHPPPPAVARVLPEVLPEAVPVPLLPTASSASTLPPIVAPISVAVAASKPEAEAIAPPATPATNAAKECKGTLLTYWNNFVPAFEPWLAEKRGRKRAADAWSSPAEWPCFAAHPVTQRGIDPFRPYPRYFRIAPPGISSYSTTSPVFAPGSGL